MSHSNYITAKRPGYMGVLASLVCVTALGAESQVARHLPVPEVARTIVETARLTPGEISPDGKWVWYGVSRQIVRENTPFPPPMEYFLQAIPEENAPIAPKRSFPARMQAVKYGAGLRWRPDGKA